MIVWLKEPNEVDGLLTVLHNSRLLVYSVDTPAEATQIFEFQNDRGKRLTELERLKSFLMHQIYLHSGPNADGDLVPRYLMAVIENQHIRNVAQARQRARTRLNQGLMQGVEVSFDALPMPMLEAGAVVSGRASS